MIVQFTDSKKTKISAILGSYQEGWKNLGEVDTDDDRYKEFTKNMTLLVVPENPDESAQ